MCYFIEYNLGIFGPPNQKADLGTIVHKILEILAQLKLSQQLGTVDYKNEATDWIKVDDFHIEEIIEKVYLYYTQKMSYHTWTIDHFKEVKKLIHAVLASKYNPLYLHIVQPEAQFNFKIEKPWAVLDNGDFLSLRGTIDLIVEAAPNVYELIDWKTGQRKNWNSTACDEKTYDKLRYDPQLSLYHYAVCNMFPNIEQVIVTIYYIRDGGPFTFCFTKDDLPETEDFIRKRFEEIKKCQIPLLNKSWKCKRFCFNGQNTFNNNHIKPIQEFREGQTCRYGNYMTICEQVLFNLEKKGMKQVVDEMKKPGFKIDYYQEPGSI